MYVCVKQMLCGKFSGVVTAAGKAKGWADLAEEVSGVSGIKRNEAEIKKKWAALKTAAKNSAATLRRSVNATGGGSADSDPLDNSQQRILSLLGKACVEGITAGFDSADLPPAQGMLCSTCMYISLCCS